MISYFSALRSYSGWWVLIGVVPIQAVRTAARRRLAVLTAKELDVLGLVGHGLSNSEIAKNMYISEGTAKTHVSRILAKLQCSNRVQAAIIAHDAGASPTP